MAKSQRTFDTVRDMRMGEDDEDPLPKRSRSAAGENSERSSYVDISTYLRKTDYHASKSKKPSVRSLAFLVKNFPEASESNWSDWRWQIKQSITSSSQLSRFLDLTEDEREAIDGEARPLPFRITPYYASLIDPGNPLDPLRRSVVPSCAERMLGPGEADDPLAEDKMSPVPGIVHRYPDRVLFLTTGFCSTYCRYCTRSRLVGASERWYFNTEQWDAAIDYIRGNTRIRDVLVSGGDPLTLPDDKLDYLLGSLRSIPHVEIIRIGTKIPAVLPQRIGADLIRMMRRHHPLFINLHFTHPAELTEETRLACETLSDAGIPLGSQTVLLKGINDDPSTMGELNRGLLKMRVRPYYLYQCDPISGSTHFRTSVEKGLSVIEGLRGWTSGLAVPHYVIDAPGGGGKVPLIPEYRQDGGGSDIILKNYEGNLYRYPNSVTQ